MAGIFLALLISRLFWPTTATQKLELGIPQTFTQLGQGAINLLLGTADAYINSTPLLAARPKSAQSGDFLC